MKRVKKDFLDNQGARRLHDSHFSPFIEEVRRKSFTRSFKMPNVEQYMEERDLQGVGLENYLAHFNKEVVRVEDFSHIAAINAFTNDLQSGSFSFQLRQHRPNTYPKLVDITTNYARAKEEEVAQEGFLVRCSQPKKGEE
ncbi:hypothetical protein Ddye_021109 [Dipteronia dyeriana]|uniref:Retrotransposon gag domain-containing protein n=1 Tax=Dipteronia dyeriana TaxID=168575 RepID=A0AAD9WW11_9ROSI|nr:hypothetical protein Ddye_021109 [Dipteronia dyeriana]